MCVCIYLLAGSSDYTAVSQLVEFDTCEKRGCVNITILEDLVLEVNETFTVTLDSPAGLDPRISLDPTRGEILIIDNDGKHCLTFLYTYF